MIIPEVTWLDGPPPDAADLDADRRDDAALPTMAEKVAASTPQPDAKPVAARRLRRRATPAPPPADPLAALLLLSEEERLALFT